MFKRLCGATGPAWLAAGSTGAVSEDVEIERRGWGYLHGDEEPVVDTATLSDTEIARLMGLPLDATADASASASSQPRVSALGYSLDRRAPDAVRAPLTPLAKRVLLHERATEPPGSYTLADGTPFPPEGTAGVFLSPLSGAPLFTSEQRRRSTSGWPSFASADAEDAPWSDLSQHVETSTDVHGGMARLECREVVTGAHLGHDFDGQLCINAASLIFVPAACRPPAWLQQAGLASPAVGAVVTSSPEYLGVVRAATLAAGCFWSLRATLAATPGVLKAVAGFTGGDGCDAPSYEEVCAGDTGHVEAVSVAYDPRVLSYDQLLERYWHAVPDPTASYRQGADVGPQYAPAVFFHSEAQRETALASRAALEAKLTAGSVGGAVVVVNVRPAVDFWAAADEHQR